MMCSVKVMKSVAQALEKVLGEAGCGGDFSPSTKLGKICNGGPLNEGVKADLLREIYAELKEETGGQSYPPELYKDLDKLSVTQLLSRVIKDACR
ncbi:hypothetical protein NHF40_10835 [Maricaulaceae bacterium EIL42A08]|nr:hypothetical protein [Maricaulaceae bacterium EIL42A08]